MGHFSQSTKTITFCLPSMISKAHKTAMAFFWKAAAMVLMVATLEMCSGDVVVVDEVVEGDAVEAYNHAEAMAVARAKYANASEPERWRQHRRIIQQNERLVKEAERAVANSAYDLWGNVVNYF